MVNRTRYWSRVVLMALDAASGFETRPKMNRLAHLSYPHSRARDSHVDIRRVAKPLFL